MYKIEIEYKPFLGDKEQMYLGVRMISEYTDANNCHIAADCMIATNILKGLPSKKIKDLIMSLNCSFEACIENINERKKLMENK